MHTVLSEPLYLGFQTARNAESALKAHLRPDRSALYYCLRKLRLLLYVIIVVASVERAFQLYFIL
jgi:hypothetical protein